jgi:serine/threonine-protein kinase
MMAGISKRIWPLPVPKMNTPEDRSTKKLSGEDAAAERWQEVKRIFSAAGELVGIEREKFLAGSCGENDDLRREVEKLLASMDSSESFMEQPAIHDAASLFDEKKTMVEPRTTGNMKNGQFVAGTVLAGRYRIIGLLGKGGMGEVYKAEDIKLSQTVALKFLPDKMEKNRAAIELFHSEVRIARQVSHANVCRVFDIGELEERHFLSMEFIDGDDLSSLLKRIGRLPSERAIEIARQLCVGLSAIHHAGILHRDFKPANVIIDGNGKARITDFGIAGIEEEISKDTLRVGTPAYMSPEQISGKGVSQRSDIYALGLVLYEIFTGKQAFTADSIPELIRKHQSETPTNPSDHVKGIDPLVESVIFQCLEKDPNDRPPTALHVAMALPGGNPLQVALEAGQTPSPEMVAASPKKGALKPAVALACLIGGIALLAFCMYASMKIASHNRIPFTKSPEVLSERANEIIRKLGYTDTPVDTQYYLNYDYAYFNHVRQTQEAWMDISTSQPLVVVFEERQSPYYMSALMAGDGDLFLEPQIAGGMRTIRLDTRGRMVEFSAVPPEFTGNANGPDRADWAPVFTASELDPAKFRETEPRWTPPVAFDARAAWEGSLPDHPEIPLRVEAAAFQGKTVFFKLVYPWTKAITEPEEHITARDWIGIFIYIGLLVGILVTAIFLAWRNSKSGSSDRRGAFKIGLAVLILTFCGIFFGTNHVPAFFPELERFMHALREGLRNAAFTWLTYLAVEPIVRRNWPELVVSWNRLLVGDWRDPLVGRDVLIGSLIGIAHFSLIYVAKMGERFFYNDISAILFPVNSSLSGLRFSIASILGNAGGGMWAGFVFVCLLVILFLLFRRRLYAGVALFILMATVEILFFASSLAYLPVTLAISVMMSVLIYRFGLIATVTSMFVFLSISTTLFTLNLSAWYAGSMFLTVFVILALLFYGFRTSLAGQRLLGDALHKIN